MNVVSINNNKNENEAYDSYDKFGQFTLPRPIIELLNVWAISYTFAHRINTHSTSAEINRQTQMPFYYALLHSSFTLSGSIYDRHTLETTRVPLIAAYSIYRMTWLQ